MGTNWAEAADANKPAETINTTIFFILFFSMSGGWAMVVEIEPGPNSGRCQGFFLDFASCLGKADGGVRLWF
jgi:hypothetical protein